jgi:hypothetical protein
MSISLSERYASSSRLQSKPHIYKENIPVGALSELAAAAFQTNVYSVYLLYWYIYIHIYIICIYVCIYIRRISLSARYAS